MISNFDARDSNYKLDYTDRQYFEELIEEDNAEHFLYQHIGRCCELEKRVKELEQKLQWQPMETAPKDENGIFAITESQNGYREKCIAVCLSSGEWICADVTYGNPVAWLPSPPINEEDEK